MAPTTTDDDANDGFMTLPQLVKYSGLTASTLRRYMTQATNPLPAHHVQPPGVGRGKVLISKRAFDSWVASFPPPRVQSRTPDASANRWRSKLNRD